MNLCSDYSSFVLAIVQQMQLEISIERRNDGIFDDSFFSDKQLLFMAIDQAFQVFCLAIKRIFIKQPKQ